MYPKIYPVSEFCSDSFPEDLFNVYRIFKEEGFKIYLVGGAVRDFICHQVIDDYDLVTDAQTKSIVEILKKLQAKIYYKGQRFGVISGSYKNLKIEISSFRQDITNDRLPEVSFEATMEQDALRRDLTYNALYYDFENNYIIDYTDGVKDIQNGITQFIGNPVERISQDRLRILRIVRYACRYGHLLSEDIINIVKEQNLDGISKERIYDEIMKTFKLQEKKYLTFDYYLSTLQKMNMFPYIFKNMDVVYDSPIESAHLCIYLASMFKNNTKIKNKMRNIKFNNNLIEKTSFLIKLLNFQVEKVSSFLKKRNKLSLDDEILSEWCERMCLPITIQKFITYRTRINKDLVSQAIVDKGEESLTTFLDRLEQKYYISYLNDV